MNRTFIILLFLTISFTFGQSRNSNFEFSGIDQFWKIVNILESNREPSNKDWDKLFRTPGYKVLTSGEFTKDFFKQNFKLVFKPSEKNKLTEKLQSGRNIHHLNHYIKVRENKTKVKEQLKNLKRNEFNRKAINRTIEFLPQNRVSQSPPVSFVIFESNGRGSSPLVVDLAASIEWDFMSFLSHEYHHWYRSRQLQINLRKVSSEDRDIVNVLSLIEAEGIADMVDKKDWFTKSNSAVSQYARQFINDVGRTSEVIHKIDETFKKIKNNPSNKRNLSKSLMSYLPQRGHTTGYYMASLILQNISKKELIKCVGSPFDFILLYDRAAKFSSGKYPSFSKETIEILTQLRSKYTS